MTLATVLLELVDRMETLSVENIKLTTLVVRLANLKPEEDSPIARLLETTSMPPGIESDLRARYTELRALIGTSTNLEDGLRQLLIAIPTPSRTH